MSTGEQTSQFSARRQTIIPIRKIGKPERATQIRVVALLRYKHAAIPATLEQRQTKTRVLKQGMMQELLTGSTRLLGPQESLA